MNDEKYMKIAIELAKKGCGWANPNPMVGAVIVKDGEIIGKGCHQKCGGFHAERNAIAFCSKSMEGATLYVTLEPCCHFGKTPPCTDAIIENKISRVVIGAKDPNTLVSGKGISILRQNGIEVITDILKAECTELNEVFFHYIVTKTPFAVMKYAMTLDGKIATYSGKSKWITGETARQHVHSLRHKYSAIMVGIGTVLADDPLLTCRLPDGRNPKRIICDTNLRIPIYSKIVRSAKDISTYIATCSEDEEKIKQLINNGCRILKIPKNGEHLDLKVLNSEMGKNNIDSILLEGGATLNYSALKSGIVNKVMAYISPKIVGGEQAKTPVSGAGVENPNDAFKFKRKSITVLDEDILLEYDVK